MRGACTELHLAPKVQGPALHHPAPAPRCESHRLHRHLGAGRVSGISVQGAASCVALLVVLLASPLQRWRVQEAEVERIRSQYELASWVSQARLPRTEPSTELITAHKVNHRAAHVAGRALGIFGKVRSHRAIVSCDVTLAVV